MSGNSKVLGRSWKQEGQVYSEERVQTARQRLKKYREEVKSWGRNRTGKQNNTVSVAHSWPKKRKKKAWRQEKSKKETTNTRTAIGESKTPKEWQNVYK